MFGRAEDHNNHLGNPMLLPRIYSLGVGRLVSDLILIRPSLFNIHHMVYVDKNCGKCAQVDRTLTIICTYDYQGRVRDILILSIQER